jgi:hypothetical protein
MRVERHLSSVSREQIVVVRYEELVRHAEALMRSLAWPAKGSGCPNWDPVARGTTWRRLTSTLRLRFP